MDMKNQKRRAIEAVAKQFSATMEEGGGVSEPHVRIAGKKVSLQVATIRKQGGSRTKPRLRFDKVAIRLLEQLQAGLHEAVPDGVIVLVSVTAPIRLAAKTEAVLQEKARALLMRRLGEPSERGTINSNQIRIRVVRTDARPASKVIGFVHNPETDPQVLFDATRSLLRVLSDPMSSKGSGDRWLVLLNPGGPSHLEAYRYIYSQLRIPTHFKKAVMVFADGRVETLA
jgi:hypothetical protein